MILYLQKNYAERCNNCYNVITEPICNECYLKELKIWLEKCFLNELLIVSIIARAKQKFKEESINESICILCETENVSICTYCYFSKIHNILVSSNLPRELIDEFLEMFNYSLYRARDDSYRQEKIIQQI